MIENRSTVTAPVQSALLLAAFVGLTIFLSQAHKKMGPGSVESILQRLFAPASKLLAPLFVR